MEGTGFYISFCHQSLTLPHCSRFITISSEVTTIRRASGASSCFCGYPPLPLLLLLSPWVVSDSLRPRGLQPAKLLCPWDFPGKSPRVGCDFLLQGISWPRDQTSISCLAGGFLTTEPPGKHFLLLHQLVSAGLSQGSVSILSLMVTLGL